MRRATTLLNLFLAGFAACPLFASDGAAPVLHKGLWRFERTFEYADGRAPGSPIRSERCVDPEAMADEQLAMFRKMGCSAERSRADLAEWRIQVTCDRPGLPKGTSTSALTVSGPDAYEARIVNQGELALPIVRERLVAKRLGDC